MRILVLLLLSWIGAQAALLPEALRQYSRGEVHVYQPEDAALFAELGLQEAERATFASDSDGAATVTSMQFIDDTGAYAAFCWLKSGKGYYSGYGERSWTNDAGTLIHFGNYVYQIDGAMPDDEAVETMLTFSPRIQLTPDPPVLGFVPTRPLEEDAHRYVLGPVGLERTAPEVPPSAVGFHFGAEAYYDVFQTEDGPLRMLLISYPAPQMARAQVEEMYKLGNVVAKRSGPLIAVVVAPASADGAERLLARVRYQAEVTEHYSESSEPKNIGSLVVEVMILCGILILLCIVGGILVAGARMFAGKVAPGSILAPPRGDGMIHLDIDKTSNPEA